MRAGSPNQCRRGIQPADSSGLVERYVRNRRLFIQFGAALFEFLERPLRFRELAATHFQNNLIEAQYPDQCRDFVPWQRLALDHAFERIDQLLLQRIRVGP